MNAPVIWIVLPALIAALLVILHRWERITMLLGTLASVALAWAAWQIPIGRVIVVGPWSLKLSSSLAVLGRQLIITDENRPMLALIYLAAGLWFGGAWPAKAGKMLVPAGLGIVALMVAVLAVEPFLYAALLIEMAALLCILLLAAPGKPASRGVIRFITFQTLGSPFILFTGWLVTNTGAASGGSQAILGAAALLGLGFAFLLAVFPFHTWIPMLSEEVHPYASGFVFFMLPGIVTLFGLTFIERYTWLNTASSLYLLIRSAGLLMVVTAGIWAAFQRHLGRIFGYAVLFDIGISLLAIGLQPGLLAASGGHLTPQILFSLLFVPRGLGLALWALALSAVQGSTGELWFRNVKGVGRRLPIASAGLVLAQFSLAGFPLFAAFPTRMVIWQALGQISTSLALWALLGSAGLLAGGLQSLAVLVMGTSDVPWQITEKRLLLIYLALGIAAVFAIRYVG